MSPKMEHPEQNLMLSVIQSSCTLLVVDEIELLSEDKFSEDISRCASKYVSAPC